MRLLDRRRDNVRGLRAVVDPLGDDRNLPVVASSFEDPEPAIVEVAGQPRLKNRSSPAPLLCLGRILEIPGEGRQDLDVDASVLAPCSTPQACGGRETLAADPADHPGLDISQ
jgi:hypothetical protein